MSSTTSQLTASSTSTSFITKTQQLFSKRLLAVFALSGASAAALWVLNRYYWRRKQLKSLQDKIEGSQEETMAKSASTTNTSLLLKSSNTAAPMNNERNNVSTSAENGTQLERPTVCAELNRSTADNASSSSIPSSQQERISLLNGTERGEITKETYSNRRSPNWVDEVAGGTSEGRRLVQEESCKLNYSEKQEPQSNGPATTTLHPLISLQNGHSNSGSNNGYENAESPSSNNSEGSADSGRATGGLTSSSPFDVSEMIDIQPMYEFEIPNSLVGLIIGVGGKTIKELCTRTNVKMLIRDHHTPAKFTTYQICSVEGKRENINKCLHLIRHRFPADRFPNLNLKPVLPPPLPTVASTLTPQPIPLTLPVGVPCEVYISAHLDAGHFFVQLPTHPSFSSLPYLDKYMSSVYSQPSGIPELPKPCSVGLLCAAPAYNGWYRAITVDYDAEQDEVLVRYVDYGGFARVPRTDLKQIRNDFLSLPLQAVECYLANVEPVDGTSHWSDEASELFQKLCAAKISQAELVGYNKNDSHPCIELYVVDENKKSLRVDHVLLERGLAKPADPTRIIRLQKMMTVPSQQMPPPNGAALKQQQPQKLVSMCQSCASQSSMSANSHHN